MHQNISDDLCHLHSCSNDRLYSGCNSPVPLSWRHYYKLTRRRRLILHGTLSDRRSRRRRPFHKHKTCLPPRPHVNPLLRRWFLGSITHCTDNGIQVLTFAYVHFWQLLYHSAILFTRFCHLEFISKVQFYHQWNLLLSPLCAHYHFYVLMSSYKTAQTNLS